MTGRLSLVLFSLFVKSRITVQLIWSTEKLSITCCQYNNQLLMWNFTEGVNETITELQWFFNGSTLICFDSMTIGFHMETLYERRVERNGTAGILLKNVSMNDAGEYTLYVKLAEEKIQNVQHIVLTVEEQVPYQCTTDIEIHPPNDLTCSTTCSERSELSPEWIFNGTGNPVGIGRHLRFSAEINEQAFCCLRGLKCHDDDQFKFCKPNPIPSKVLTSKEDIDTRRQNDTNSNLLIVLVVLLAAILFAIIVTYLVLRRRKSHRSLHDSNSHQNIQIVNNISMDADILKYMGDSQKQLMIELDAIKEETRKLKRLLPSYQELKKLQMTPIDKFVQTTEVICHYHNHSDTDTSETTADFEDAVSEPLVEHDKFGSIDSRLYCGSSSSDQY